MVIVLVPFWLIVYRGYKEPGAAACVPGQFLAPSVQYEYYTYIDTYGVHTYGAVTRY